MAGEPITNPKVNAAGLAIVLVLHAGVLWGLWQYRLLPTPHEAMTVFVNFIAPPVMEKREAPKPPQPSKPKVIEKAEPRQIIAIAPIVAPADYVVPPPPLPRPALATEDQPAPATAAPPAPAPKPAGPVALSSELAVACPERSAPAYPPLSRRLGEHGTVVLRVELDERGRFAAVRVLNSSGYARLDEAALGTVRTWRCTPAQRNGEPVRAVALQSFTFLLEGN